MKASIKTKNPFTYPSYMAMIGNEVIKVFYYKAEAKILRDKLNLESK